MTRYGLFEKVYLHGVVGDERLATFYVASLRYQQEAKKAVKAILELVQGECWIWVDPLLVPRGIYANQKGWNEDEIKAFEKIVRTLARLHKWRVAKPRKSKK